MLLNKIIYPVLSFLSLLLFTQCGNNSQQKKEPRAIEKRTAQGLDTTSFYPAFGTDTLEREYGLVLDSIWDNYVPESGQSSTVQGELRRIIEKLDHEIRGNGKINWEEEDPQFKMLTNYLKDTLTKRGVFPDRIKKEIISDIEILADDETAVTEELYYDRLRRRIAEWCLRHPFPVKHTYLADLYR